MKNRKSKKTIIFDFDGTLADTIDLAVAVYNKIAEKSGYKIVRKEDFKKLRSQKLQDSLKEHNISKIQFAFLVFRIKKGLSKELKNMKFINEMDFVIKSLKKENFKLGIMTSNSKKNVEEFLKINNMEKVFDFVYSGRNLFGKNKVIKKLIKKERINKEDVVYVGDETRDIEATKEIGIPIISVSWGFNTKDALLKMKPENIVDKPDELLKIIIS